MRQLETYRIEFFSKILTVKVGDEAMKKIIVQIILEVVKEIVKYFFDD